MTAGGAIMPDTRERRLDKWIADAPDGGVMAKHRYQIVHLYTRKDGWEALPYSYDTIGEARQVIRRFVESTGQLYAIQEVEV